MTSTNKLSLKEKANLARQKHLEAVKLLKAAGLASFKLAEALYEIKHKKLYRYAIGEGTDTWELYCANLGISVSTADKLIDRYKVFVLTHKIPPEQLCDINTINLQYILPIVKRQPERLKELLDKARCLRSVDLMRDIAQERIQGECLHTNVDIKVYCKNCHEFLPEISNRLKQHLT